MGPVLALFFLMLKTYNTSEKSGNLAIVKHSFSYFTVATQTQKMSMKTLTFIIQDHDSQLNVIIGQ